MDSHVVLPEGWKRPRGWSTGIRIGNVLHVAGQFGWDPTTHLFESLDLADQWHTAMLNVLAVVDCAGGIPTDVAVLRIYVTDLTRYREARARIGESWQRTFGQHFPAITLLGVTGLTEPDATVEIEAVAHIAG